MFNLTNKIIIFIVCCLFLYGCKEQKQTKDIDKYVTEIKKQKIEPIEPLPQFLKVFERSSDHIDADSGNKKEKTETSCRLINYATDLFSVVGAIVYGPRQWMIVSVKNNEYYKVPVGSGIGKDCTPILKIPNQLVDVKQQMLSRRKITLIFNKVPVRNALLWVAELAHLNVMVGQEVNGTLTLQLKNISWQNAMIVLLKSKNLFQKKEGSVLYINKRVNQKGVGKVVKSRPEQQTLVQHLKYANVNDIIKIISNSKQSLLSPSGYAGIDARTNAIFIHDSSEQTKQALKVIKQLDVPVPQVLIKAKLVNIDNDYEKELGIRFNLRNRRIFDRSSSKGDERVQEDMVNLSQAIDGWGVALTKVAKGTILDLELSALENEGKAEIVSSPSLLTTNQQPAKIEAGEEIPYQESVSDGVTATAFKKAVLSLKVTPQILSHHQLILHLEVSQDKRSSQEVKGVPAIDTRHLSTEVLVHDGQTVVLGGIYEHTQTHRDERVPFFSDLPILGVLFRHHKAINNRRELLIFVTPKIINSESVR